MPEHEWKIKRQGLGGHIVIRCEKSQEELMIDEAESRLNEYETLKAATEELSAEDARFAVKRIEAHIGYEWDDDEGTMCALDAYADTLEGK